MAFLVNACFCVEPEPAADPVETRVAEFMDSDDVKSFVKTTKGAAGVAFKAADKDKNGTLTVKEIQDFCKSTAGQDADKLLILSVITSGPEGKLNGSMTKEV